MNGKMRAKRNYGRLLLIQLWWLGILLVVLLSGGLLFGVPILLVNQSSGSTEVIGIIALIGVSCMLATWIFLYLRWGFSVLLVIDPKAGRPPIGEAFSGSWRMTRGITTWFSLGVLGFLGTLILIFSFACLVLPGIFLGGPYFIAVIATAYALLCQARIVAKNGCIHCGYPRSASSDSICSECGRPWSNEADQATLSEEA